MKKVSIMIVMATLLVSCGKTEIKTTEMQKKENAQSAVTKKEQTPVTEQQPEIQKETIVIDGKAFDVSGLPKITGLLDSQNPLEPTIEDLPNKLIWQRHNPIAEIIKIDDQTQLVTDTSKYKSSSFTYSLLNEIGGDKTVHAAHRGTMAVINYTDYLGFENEKIVVTNKEVTEVYDIWTDKLLYECTSRKDVRGHDQFSSGNYLSGNELYVCNPYDIRCIDLATKKDRYKLNLETIDKTESLIPGKVYYLSFIGLYNGSMYVFIRSEKIILLKVLPDGSPKVIYKSKNTYGQTYDDVHYLIDKNQDYIACFDGHSTSMIIDTKTDGVYEISKGKMSIYEGRFWSLQKKINRLSKYIIINDILIDLAQRKPILRLEDRSISDYLLHFDTLFAKHGENLYCFDLNTLTTKWHIRLKDDFRIIWNFDVSQFCVGTNKEILYFFIDDPGKMWRLKLDFDVVVDPVETQKSTHYSTPLQSMSTVQGLYNPIMSMYDRSANRTYLSGWTSFCVGDDSGINPIVFPTVSGWCLNSKTDSDHPLESMDIFIRWNGAESTKATVKCNSKEKSDLRSEVMLEPGKLTRLKVWFDDFGQVLTIGDKSYNIFIAPYWCD